jgi:hypothetical protein
MQFIEKLLGVSPDGGSGALEACILIVPILVASFAIARRRARRQVPCRV